MALGEVLLEVLMEMMGIPTKKKPPPRRTRPRVSQPVEEPSPDIEPDDEQLYPTLEDLVYQPVVPEVEATEAPAEAIEPPPPVRDAGPAGEARRREWAQAAQVLSGRRERADTSAGAFAGDIVRQLQSDPAAARAAFVYSEIFGPPMADRNENNW